MTLWAGAVALGLAFAFMALGVYITFRVLSFPDLTVDGSLPLGAAVSGVLIVNWGWQPWATLLPAFAAGALAGVATAVLNTRLNIHGLLAGILVSFGLWTVNLRVMGERANLPLLGVDTVLTPLLGPVDGAAKALNTNPSTVAALAIYLVLALLVAAALNWFLHTELGLGLRASGDNDRMVRAMGINPAGMKYLGLAISNGLVGLSGSLVAQYQGFSDVGIGLGMIVAGLASVIIGETLVRPNGVLSTILAVVIGSTFYRLVIAAALFIGLGPTDMRLVTSLIVIAALGLPQIRARLRVRGWQPA